jgi:acetamidase/formamidase
MQIFAAEDLKYVYSPWHRPVGTVQPGERFTVDTQDCFTGLYRDPANFSPETAAWVEENLNGVTGPISVTGAKPGDAIEIHIESVTVTSPGSLVVSRCQALSPADWWHEEYRGVSLPVVDGQIRLRDDWTVPVRPLIGCLATAPGREAILSRREGSYGGNMDCNEITSGATVVLPVETPGAFLYFGDCKAAMGNGEITAAPEVATRIVASATPVPRPRTMNAPRVRTSTRLTTVVSGISLAGACRTAFAELKAWLEDEYGLTSDDAAVVMGVGAHCGVCQVSNALHTAQCSISLSLLPPTPGPGPSTT